MRVQGAGALKEVLSLSGPGEIADSIQREVWQTLERSDLARLTPLQTAQLPSLDATNVHGALAALQQIASLLPSEHPSRDTIFASLTTVRPAALISPQAAEILQTACDLISAVLEESILLVASTQQILDRYIEASMKRKEEGCHEAVARLYGRLSILRNCSNEVKK